MNGRAESGDGMPAWLIERGPSSSPGRNSGTAFGPFVWAVATAADGPQDIRTQSRLVLERLTATLSQLKSDKSRMLSVQVFLADMADKKGMDEVWLEWIGRDPGNWPQRACVGADLSPGVLIEVVAVAARQQGAPENGRGSNRSWMKLQQVKVFMSRFSPIVSARNSVL